MAELWFELVGASPAEPRQRRQHSPASKGAWQCAARFPLLRGSLSYATTNHSLLQLTRLAFGSSTRATFPSALSRRPPAPPLWELPLSLLLSSNPRKKPLSGMLTAGLAQRAATQPLKRRLALEQARGARSSDLAQLGVRPSRAAQMRQAVLLGTSSSRWASSVVPLSFPTAP